MSGADIKPVVVEMAQAPITEADALADLHGQPRPDNPSPEATAAQAAERCTFPDCDCDSPYRAAGACAWRAVPVEPTDAMVDATHHGQPVDDIWRDMLAAAPALPAAPAEPKTLTDEQIDRIAENCAKSMDGGIRGFMATWGWRQFARELLDVCAGYERAAPAPAARVDAPSDAPLAATLRQEVEAIRDECQREAGKTATCITAYTEQAGYIASRLDRALSIATAPAARVDAPTPDREALLGDAIRALIARQIRCSDDLPADCRPRPCVGTTRVRRGV